MLENIPTDRICISPLEQDLFRNDFWRNDGATRDYVRRNYDKLQNPKSMTHLELGDACTYCENFWNPYAEELMRRAGCCKKFNEAFNDADRMKALRNAARSFGFDLM